MHADHLWELKSITSEQAISKGKNTFKMRPVQNVSCDNEFHLNDNKNNFHINGFALSLALKQKLMATWKWPTPQLMGKRISIYIFRELGQIFW